MKLRNTFKHRIIIDKNKEVLDFIEACLEILNSQVLNPLEERIFSKKNKPQKLERAGHNWVLKRCNR